MPRHDLALPRESEPPPTLPERRKSHMRFRAEPLPFVVVDLVLADLSRDPRSEDFEPNP